MQKTLKITETLANGYSSESTQQELSNEYQNNRVLMVFKNLLSSCALEESSLSIGRVNLARSSPCEVLSCTQYPDLLGS